MKSKTKKVLLPLLGVLKKLPSSDRVILMSHLDDKTRDTLYETIAHVLRSPSVPMRKKLFLKSKLGPFKKHLRFLADKRKPSKLKKNRLTQMGGAPMGYVLRTAVPLLLNLYQK